MLEGHAADCACCAAHGEERGADGFDSAERKCVGDIGEYGLHIIQVTPSETDEGFSYSVGLFDTYRHPEIVVFGQKVEWQRSMLNALADRIRDDATVFQAGKLYSDILDGFHCRFEVIRSEESYRKYFGWDMWYYTMVKPLPEPFPVLQLIWPDLNDVFPDAPGYDNPYRQPILS
jgi:hypothetical protein